MSVHFTGSSGKYFSVCEETNLVKYREPGQIWEHCQMHRLEPWPCFMLGPQWRCPCSTALAVCVVRELQGTPYPGPGLESWRTVFEGTDLCPSWSASTAWNARQQLQENKPHVWQSQQCSADIPQIFHSPAYSKERFSALQNYMKVQCDWQMSAFSKIDVNFITWLCHQRKCLCPMTQATALCRRRLRENVCTCVCLVYTFINISMLCWNLIHKINRGEIHMRNSNRCMAGLISPYFRHLDCLHLHLSQPACSPFVARGKKWTLPGHGSSSLDCTHITVRWDAS